MNMLNVCEQSIPQGIGDTLFLSSYEMLPGLVLDVVECDPWNYCPNCYINYVNGLVFE